MLCSRARAGIRQECAPIKRARNEQARVVTDSIATATQTKTERALEVTQIICSIAQIKIRFLVL